MTDKISLRDVQLRLRSQIPSNQASDAAQKLALHLAAHITNPHAIIAGYSAMRGEISLAPTFAALPNPFCLPVIITQSAPLQFRSWRPGQKLIKGVHNTDVPEENNLLIVPDIVLVPLVAFDARGHRLGYGGGYYDRTIAQLREAKKQIKIIGVAFSSQQVEDIEPEPHDQTLDCVVTEKGLVIFS